MQMQQTPAAKRLTELTDDILTLMKSHVKIESITLSSWSRDDSKLRSFLDELKAACEASQQREALIALIGEMSGGKSAIINMLIGHPLLPMAQLPTSECPVETRYGGAPKLQVFTYSKSEDEQTLEKTIYSLDDSAALSEEFKRRLIGYAKTLREKRVLNCENLDYYFNGNFSTASEDEILAELDDIYRVIQLMLVPLTASVGRGNPDLEHDPRYQQIIDNQRQILTDLFGIPEDAPFAVRVWIDSAPMKNGLVLVDLPGLGSGNALHTEITKDYMRRADAFILPFNPIVKTQEIKDALTTLFKYEHMGMAGKDSRFISVINKCDNLLAEYGTCDEALGQAVNSIRPALTQIEIPEFIPISARYAEYRLVEHGISPSLTLEGKKRRRSSPSETDEQIIEYLRQLYETEFEYYDPGTGRAVCYSTKRFMEETIGEYAPKVRFLNAIRSINAIMQKYGNYAHDLTVELEMLQLLGMCGDHLMRSLLDKMSVALHECETVLIQSLDQIIRDVDEQHTTLIGDLEKAKNAYVDGLSRADSKMKEHLRQEKGKMICDSFGHVIIDPNAFTGTRETNLELFNGLIQYFKNFSFDQYLQPGDKLLEKSLNDERALYRKGIRMIEDSLTTLLTDVHDALQKAYADFAQELKPQGNIPAGTQKIYADNYRRACEAILTYLTRLVNQIVKNMQDDPRVDQEIQTTVNEVRNKISRLKHLYNTYCVSYMNSKVTETSLWARKSIDIKTIEREIGNQFRSEDQSRSDLVGLESVLLDGRTSHKERMQRTMQKEVFADFAKDLSDKIAIYLPKITNDINGYIDDSGAQLKTRYQRMAVNCQDVANSLNDLYKDETTQAFLLNGKGASFSQADAGVMEQELKNDIAKFESLAKAARAQEQANTEKGEQDERAEQP